MMGSKKNLLESEEDTEVLVEGFGYLCFIIFFFIIISIFEILVSLHHFLSLSSLGLSYISLFALFHRLFYQHDYLNMSKDNKRHAKADRGKPKRPQPYPKKYRQL